MPKPRSGSRCTQNETGSKPPLRISGLQLVRAIMNANDIVPGLKAGREHGSAAGGPTCPMESKFRTTLVFRVVSSD